MLTGSIASYAAFTLIGAAASTQQVEQWDIFELTLEGPGEGNPFAEVQLSAEFTQNGRTSAPDGFYDGEGTYCIRFMPDALGEWEYVTKSNRDELDGQKGCFTCVSPSADNHGPVRVHDEVFLRYADGTSYLQFGTTCYAWTHQGDAMEEQTLRTLAEAPFNKMRMCVFPKSYSYNQNEPVYYPYEGEPLKDWDLTRFKPEFWHHFEKRIRDLMQLGIEADIILFHSYDRWGFKEMGHQTNLYYLRYAVARLAAYRNVWWSFANEYDLHKWPMEDWDAYFQLVQEKDPYNRLRSIHNCREWYDHTKPWVTHLSVQGASWVEQIGKALDVREKYRKPVLFDEVRYEGNIKQGWGNITAEQMVKEFWIGTIGGCYVGHGETYQHPEDLLWWAKGGVLRGQSPQRIMFLKQIMAQAPVFDELDASVVSDTCGMLSKPGEYYLLYSTDESAVTLELPGEQPYRVEIIDTWEMSVTFAEDALPGVFTFAPPKPGCALRLIPSASGE